VCFYLTDEIFKIISPAKSYNLYLSTFILTLSITCIMENVLPAPPIERCAHCFAEVKNDDVYCTNCGYPLKGSELDQRSFIANNEIVHIDIAEFHKKVRSAGNTLYYLAGLFVISGIVNFFILKNDPNVLAVVIPIFILAILFLALGGYSRKQPLACLVSGLCLYIIVQVILAFDNPVNLASGIIIKIVIIGYLIKGIKSAIGLEKIKKENNIA
jgi:hypothetical protein